MGDVNTKGFSNKGAGASVKSVGPQGVQGQGEGSAPCDYASMPISGGKVPKKMAPKGSLSLEPQNGIMPKVGK